MSQWMSEPAGLLELIAHLATAVGVIIAAWQLTQSKDSAASQFEDQLNAQYRAIVQQLPVEALLGEPLSAEKLDNSLPVFYHYFDLTNEQVFLRTKNRVRLDTFVDWREGIRSLLAKPAFAAAWSEIKRRAPDSFKELRKLEAEQFSSDPRKWPDLEVPRKPPSIPPGS